jgi:predicted nucleic acid-binding protein
VRVLFDTSVLLAALIQPHPNHDIALPWLKRAKDREIEMTVSAHSLAELYAVLSTLPVSPRILPAVALRLIRENIESAASVIALSASDYWSVLKGLGKIGFSGGIVYDALILRAALKARADQLVTFNVKDFRRLSADTDITITAP